MDVLRTDTGHICANGKWFLLSDLTDATYRKVKASGSDNPAFDMPPWFRSGSPYADAICALGCAEVPAPMAFRIECVPPLGPVWRGSRMPAWPEIFGVCSMEAA